MRGKILSINKPVSIESTQEIRIDEVKFKVYKHSTRVKPSNPKNIVLFPCFSEFGTEILGTLYCIPLWMQRNFRGKYSIAVGWHGRNFLYKNIVDEFWEIEPEKMWLRNYSRAFHSFSKNLLKIERSISTVGKVVSSIEMGNPATYPKLPKCLIKDCGGDIEVFEDKQQCRKCRCLWPAVGIFSNPLHYKKQAAWPIISDSKKLEMKKYLKPNSVGITARNRDAYGRNLPPIFYERLIYLLEDMGYNPIWIGEKQTIHPCPFSRIVDFSSTEDANDLENTLALVSQLKFTIQFWTASTRLAGMVGTPFILFESIDQIYGGHITPGHEGFRILLCTKGEKKLVTVHFNDIKENNNLGLKLVEQAVDEIQCGNFSDIMQAEYPLYGKVS